MAVGSVGLKTYIWNNNILSGLLLVMFPLLLVILFGLFFYFYAEFTPDLRDKGITSYKFMAANVRGYGPYAVIIALFWFVISFLFHHGMINALSGARPVTRMEQPRIYNLLENLCISRGMTMPQLQIIHTPALNAFASGIRESDYRITLTSGLIEELNDEELEAVLAHELTHIMNRDVRLLVISLVFVGMISTLCDLAWRSIRYAPRSGRATGGKGSKDVGRGVLVAAVVLAIGYLFSIVLRFALSRRREYLADAGAVELTKNPDAMVSALEKISGNSEMKAVPSEFKEMMIENAHDNFVGIFATHPPIERRIRALRDIGGVLG